MIISFFDRRVEKHSLNGAKTRLFNEVCRKMAKSDGQFIFFSFFKKMISGSTKRTGYLCATITIIK